jgi:hypothetical protein
MLVLATLEWQLILVLWLAEDPETPLLRTGIPRIRTVYHPSNALYSALPCRGTGSIAIAVLGAIVQVRNKMLRLGFLPQPFQPFCFRNSSPVSTDLHVLIHHVLEIGMLPSFPSL